MPAFGKRIPLILLTVMCLFVSSFAVTIALANEPLNMKYIQHTMPTHFVYKLVSSND